MFWKTTNSSADESAAKLRYECSVKDGVSCQTGFSDLGTLVGAIALNSSTSGRAVPPLGSGARPSVGLTERKTRPSGKAATGTGSRVSWSSTRTRAQPLVRRSNKTQRQLFSGLASGTVSKPVAKRWSLVLTRHVDP